MPPENAALILHDRELARQDAWTDKWGYIKMQVELINKALNQFIPFRDETRRALIKEAVQEILTELDWQEENG